MEKYELKNDVKVFCATAKSFPEGVAGAFQTLENIDPSIRKRPFYGISCPDKSGKIIYKAAVTEAFDGEGKQYGMETFTITKGVYMTETVFDFIKDPETIIGNTFQKLLKTPNLDRQSSCIEWYKSNTELMCMVRLAE